MSRPLLLIPDDLVCGDSSATPSGEDGGFGALLTERGHLPLESMDVRARIDGLLARVTVRQTFVNAVDQPLEAAYIFPLPDRAAVTRFRTEIAGRVIEGVLEERGAAREQYDRAIAQGRRAAIAEEDRPGVFNLRVGNLMPGERATVELTFCSVLPYADGEATFRFPLVVAPRYIPGIPLPGPSAGDGVALDTGDVPDASRISPPVLLPGFPNPVRLSLEVELRDNCVPVDQVRSSLHAVCDEPADGYRRMRLYAGERLNRDFILRFRLGGPAIQSTLTLHPDADDGQTGTFALTVVPPTDGGGSPPRPRDVVFVLDRSGSMDGWKIVAARRALARMIDTLTDADQFGLIAFDSFIDMPASLPPGLSPATDRNRFRAVEYLAAVGIRGGTEMAGPLDRAVKLLTPGSSDRDRILVLITDGQVGNEDQILRTLGPRLKGIRVFTLGIDRAVNEAFLRRLAERGGGSCELVESEDRLDEVMAGIHRRIGTPLLTGLDLSGTELAIEPGEIVPRRLPDLFAGSPLLVLGRYHGRAGGTLTIRAAGTGGGPWSEAVAVQVRDNPAIAAAWARGQIRQLEDRYAAGDGDRSALERSIVAISLKFHVLCRFTAYVAIDRSQTVNEGGRLHRITQPVEQPEGWDGLSVPLGSSVPMDCMASLADSAATLRVEDFLVKRSSMRTPRARRDVPGEVTHCSSAFNATPVPPDDDSTAMSCTTAPYFAAPELPMNLPDRFEVRKSIATGGMRRIYQVFDKLHNRLVSVTMILGHGLLSWTQTLSQRVIEAMATLVHRAFVRVLDVVSIDGGVAIVQPLIEGRTLQDQLKDQGRMKPGDAAMLVAELAEALQLAHDQGLVHGDIMPSNILLGDDSRPRLLGMVEAVVKRDGGPSGEIPGNPWYFPPETIRGDGTAGDPRVDVYGLGLVLYVALTNERPYSAQPAIKLLEQILNTPPKAPRRIARSVPAALEAICLKAMAKKPDERYATAAELAAALRGFLAPRRRTGFWK
jgi:Ca-activated chloride channel family protein